jgi:hypothetical protein
VRNSLASLLLAAAPAAQTVFVDADALGLNDGSSWADAFTDLDQALAAAAPGQEIWVAEGTYTPAPPAGPRNDPFDLPSGVSVYGGFLGTESLLAERPVPLALSVLSGDLNGDDGPAFGGVADNSFHVVTVGSGASAVLLDGFTVRAGNADGLTQGQQIGAGMRASSDVTLANVTFEANRALAAGGAFATVGDIDVEFYDCVFLQNRSEEDAGGLYQEAGTILLERATFRGNSAARHGGGVWFQGELNLDEGLFEDNVAGEAGGGAYLQSTEFEFLAAVFRGNSTQSGLLGFGGGLSLADCRGRVRGSLFVANNARRGGALIATGDTPGLAAPVTLDGSTFYGNQVTSPLGGGAVFSSQVGLTLRGSILWGNLGPSGTDFDGQIGGFGYEAENSCIAGMTPETAQALGPGNHALDPMFLDPDGVDDELGSEDDDLRLGLLSPCIDAGHDDAVVGLELDLGLLPRETDDPEVADTGLGSGALADMGAYEQHTLVGSAQEFSLSAGGSVGLQLTAGEAHAGELYIVLGSATGTSPGLTFAGKLLTLNIDAYFLKTLNEAGSPPLLQGFGTLDPAGQASASFSLPAGFDPILAGLTLHHGAAVLDPLTLLPLFTSTAFPLELVP